MEIYRRDRIEGVGLSPHKGYKLSDLAFLEDYPDVAGVAVPYAEKIDLGDLSRLRNLKYLSISGSRQELDLGIFEKLEELRVEWHPKLHMPPRFSELRELLLTGYKTKTRDLSALPEIPNLTRLELVQGNVERLEGIQRFPKLQSAEFSYMKDLKDISAVRKAGGLTDLRFATCKAVEDFSVTKSMPNLRTLRIIDCGKLPSIAFLNEIPRLEEFRFVKTRIVDGDLTPLLRLKRVGFLPTKGYSHTPEQIEAAIRARGD